MLFATKTVGVTRGGAGVVVGIAVGVGVALAVADTVAVGLVDGAEPATPGVPQAANNAGAIKVSSSFLIIRYHLDHRNLARERDIPSHGDLYLAGLLTWKLIGSIRSLNGGQPCNQDCRSTPTTSQAGSPESQRASRSVRTRSSVATD